ASLAASFLAFLRGERLEVVLEAGVAPIPPMELAVPPREPARPRKCGPIRLVEKERVNGGERCGAGFALDGLDEAASHAFRIEVGPHEQTCARCGCEGDGNREQI